jgi:signal peptidase I
MSPETATKPGAPCLASETLVEAPQNPPSIEAQPHHHHHHHTHLQAFQSLLYIIIIALFIITFSVQPFRIPSESMEPTLLVGDFLLVDKQVGLEVPPRLLAPNGEIRRGDLIVFHYPVDPTMHLVKRVVAVPGDHLRLHEGRVLLNDHPVPEPYTKFLPVGPDLYRDDFPRLTSANPSVESRWWIQMHKLVANGELTVPSDSFFVLGDNRNDSEDSRYWGFVPRDAIVGKPFLIYFSLNNGAPTPGQSSATALSGSPLSGAGSTGFARWDRALHIIH